LVKVCKNYNKKYNFSEKYPVAISQEGTDQFQNPFFSLVLHMEATSGPKFSAYKNKFGKCAQKPTKIPKFPIP
jgi:hypothetical protein